MEAMCPELGSLHDMLGSADDAPIIQPHRKLAGKAPTTDHSIPRLAASGTRKPPTDGTLLNKKVAFRMLSQLGCPIQRCNPGSMDGDDGSDANSGGESYIEVHMDVQPVLFNMLKELGFRPGRNDQGVPIIRVESQHRRSQQEAAAALAARKPDCVASSEVSSEQYAVARRFNPKEQKEAIDRLSKPRPPKPPPEMLIPEMPSAKVRTAQEQKEALEKLTRPKGSRPRDSEERLQPDGSAAKIDASASRTVKPVASGDIWGSDSANTTFPLYRRSPRLSSAANAMLRSDCAVARPMSLDAKAQAPRAPSQSLAAMRSSSPGVQVTTPTMPQARPSSPIEDVLHAGEVFDEHCTDRQSEYRSFIGRRDERHQPQSDTVSWLESMGFSDDTGQDRAPKRISKTKQQENLSRLAQPRKKLSYAEQEAETAVEAPKRNAKEQSEFLSRLAQPKKPREKQEQNEESKPREADAVQRAVGYPETSKEPGAPYAQPSRLANPYLAVAQKYSSAGKVKSSASSSKDEEGREDMEPGSLPFTPSCGGCKSRLERIDETPSPEPASRPSSRSLSAGPRPRALRRPRARDDLEIQEIHVHHHVYGSDEAQPSRPPRIPSGSVESKHISKSEDEALLSKIDMLYKELVQAPQPNPSSIGEEAKGQPDVSASKELQEAVCKVLEEVLWSAVMLKRSAADDIDVQDALLWLLPKDQLRASASVCNVAKRFPKTLLQGLDKDLPTISSMLSFSGKPLALGLDEATSLLEKIKRARDGLLALAFSAGAEPGSVVEPEEQRMATPSREPLIDPGTNSTWQSSSAAPMSQRSQLTQDSSGALQKKPRKPARKTSLSHWTEESFTTLKPPPEHWFEAESRPQSRDTPQIE